MHKGGARKKSPPPCGGGLGGGRGKNQGKTAAGIFCHTPRQSAQFGAPTTAKSPSCSGNRNAIACPTSVPARPRQPTCSRTWVKTTASCAPSGRQTPPRQTNPMVI